MITKVDEDKAGDYAWNMVDKATERGESLFLYGLKVFRTESDYANDVFTYVVADDHGYQQLENDFETVEEDFRAHNVTDTGASI